MQYDYGRRDSDKCALTLMTIKTSNRWQLPDGVDELLPDAAWRVELLRRRITDLCQSWGFELVMPPLIEYLESLLTGTGETMDLQTFKLVDQHNGRTMGIRADMTPQVARIDAHALRGETPNRLFYTGSVLRARTNGFGGSRSPLQVGAELFGHAGAQSDIEIIRLMLATLVAAEVPLSSTILDLGHVGVYRGLTEQLELNEEQADTLFTSVQRGSLPDVRALLADVSAAKDQGSIEMLARLMKLRGDRHALATAREAFAGAPDSVNDALDTLQAVIDGVLKTHPDIGINIDLAELRGYSYHTGVLFAAYTENGRELSRGGRYDAVGAAFGHPRPATGFSCDLNVLADNMKKGVQRNNGIFVSADLVDEAWLEITRLRNSGERVVTGLAGIGQALQTGFCNRILTKQGADWTLETLS